MEPNDAVRADNQPQAEGPGSIKIAERTKPMVDGLSENYYVEILNPLSVTFMGKVASSRPIHSELRIVTSKDTPTLTQNEDDIRRNYGLDLRNPDHKSMAHYTQTVSIPPGATIRLPGNEAQVIVRQLVNIIMDKEGNKLLKGDSFARHQVEERIIMKQGTMSEFFTQSSVDIREVINKDLQHEHEPETEQPFPTETDPAPGTGVSYQPSGNTTDKSEDGVKRGRSPKSALTR
jgi:hypothetical protein